MSTPTLQATSISHKFDYPLFSDINFTLYPRESVAIIGRSGSGKSTLLHIFSTFLEPNKGKVKLLDRDLYTLTQSELEKMRRYEIGIVFQFHYLFKGMSAMENISIASMLSGEKIDEKLLCDLQIEGLMGQKISELSGGQQQRVSIARALCKKPRIIFADEPTGNLDKETANIVMDVLLSYIKEENATLLLVTHDMQIAEVCDKIYRLEDRGLRLI